MSSILVPFNDLASQYHRLQGLFDQAVARVLASGCYVGGPEVETFEADFARQVGVKHAIGVANGTDAIALALRALDIGPGDEVITTAVSAYPTAVGIFQSGATAVFVDVDQETGLIDPGQIEVAIGSKTRAILPVHLYGNIADLAAITNIGRKNGLVVVEDCAQAFGSAAPGVRAGQVGLAASWSFYPTKNLGGIGDGGAVTTNSDDLAERLRRLRNYGQRDRYEHVELGFNSRLDPIQAAILGVKLRHVEEDNEKRRSIADRYDRAFVAVRGLRCLQPKPGSLPNRHLYPVLLENATARTGFQRYLANEGVQTLIHYPIAMPAQTATPPSNRVGSWKRASNFCARVVSIPLYPDLTDAQIDRVIGSVIRWSSTHMIVTAAVS
jgi:dTDP-4-amino-4,6-dideoxygalactose transaminase